ncbi:MAG: Alpha-D-glucose-phosphate phosphatase YihX [Planctomycetota bacterium]
MTIRTCFFDMGNVLVHFSHDTMAQNLANVSGLPLPEIRRFLFDDQWQWLMERGERSELDFSTELSRRAQKSLDHHAVCHAAANIFQLNSEILPILQDLKTAGIRLVLLSNTSLTHLRFIEHQFNVLNWMDDKVASFEVGAMKPDPRIFHAALAKALCPPEQCFYTDDIPAYTAHASTLGIHSHTFTTATNLLAALQEIGLLK